ASGSCRSFFRRFPPSGGIIRYRTVQRMGRHLSPDKRSCHALAMCCPLCALVRAFVEGGGIGIPLQAFGRLSGECERSPESTGKLWIRADCGGKIARSKSVQVKGRVALKSLLARFTPPGKAVRR